MEKARDGSFVRTTRKTAEDDDDDEGRGGLGRDAKQIQASRLTLSSCGALMPGDSAACTVCWCPMKQGRKTKSCRIVSKQRATSSSQIVQRGRVRHIVCAASCVSRFGQLGKHSTRIVVGGAVPGWHLYEDGYKASAEFKPDGETTATDPIRSAVPKAYLILRSGVKPSREVALSIFQHIQKVLPPFNRIRRIEFSDLPKTISGKIRGVELRQTEEANVQRGARPAFEFREEDFPELE